MKFGPRLVLLILALAAQSAGANPLDGLAKLKDYSSERASSCDLDWRNAKRDSRPVVPGATLTLADLKGPCEITHIWITVAAQERAYSRLLVLRMYWDNEKNPSVECPLGDFFGVGHGIDASLSSLPVRVTAEGRARNCYWPMPFGKSARITITNEGREAVNVFYYVDWHTLAGVDQDVAYFHASYRQEFPTAAGRNYVIAEIEGRGHYVGTVLSCRQRTAGWWGEGNDYFFVDGEKEPSLRGTGTEDYFCDAWRFRIQSGDYYGAPVCEDSRVWGRTTAYRWHIPDPVSFTKSLRLEIQHKGLGPSADGPGLSGVEERADDYSSAALWYQCEPHKPFPPLPAANARLNFDYSKAIEGESLIPHATATRGRAERQKGAGLGGGAQLRWAPSVPDQALTLRFDVVKSGLYEIVALLSRGLGYGSFVFEVDGKRMGNVEDLYSAVACDREVVFKSVELTAGEHKLVVRNRGKNPTSGGYALGLDGLLLRK